MNTATRDVIEKHIKQLKAEISMIEKDLKQRQDNVADIAADVKTAKQKLLEMEADLGRLSEPPPPVSYFEKWKTKGTEVEIIKVTPQSLDEVEEMLGHDASGWLGRYIIKLKDKYEPGDRVEVLTEQGLNHLFEPVTPKTAANV